MDDALRALERAVRAAPRDADARFRLGAALLRAGSPEEAVAALRAALIESPAHVEAAHELSRVPGLARGPWPTEDGGADGARRSDFPGARRGVVERVVALPAPPRGAPVIAASGEALVATVEGLFRVDPSGAVAAFGPREEQRGPPVLASEGTLVALAGERGLRLLDAAGETLWARDLGARAFDPTVAGDIIMVGVEGAGVLALGISSGEEKWRVVMDAESYSRPALGEGLAVVAVRGDRPSVMRGYGETWRWQLHAIDERGRVRWSSKPLPDRDTGIPTTPAFAHGRVWVRVESQLYRADPRDGAMSDMDDGTRPLGAWAGEGMANDADGWDFAVVRDGVLGIAPSDDVHWTCPVARVTSRPAIGNGRVLVTSFHERTLVSII